MAIYRGNMIGDLLGTDGVFVPSRVWSGDIAMLMGSENCPRGHEGSSFQSLLKPERQQGLLCLSPIRFGSVVDDAGGSIFASPTGDRVPNYRIPVGNSGSLAH